MPIYNCELYVAEAIDSILKQTFTDFEFLIIDDCSSDNTLQIAQSYSDSRIKIITKEKNTGYTNSLNYGLSIAKGKYIARMDGDDISLPNRFKKQFDFMEANLDIAVCGTAFQILNSEQIINVPENHNQIVVGMLQECKIGHPTVMMRNSFLQLHHLIYDKKFEPAEDYDFWVKICLIGNLHNLQEVFLFYRTHENQVSNTNNTNQIEKANSVRLKLIQNLKSNLSDFEKELVLKVFSRKKEFTNEEILNYFKIKNQLNNGKIFDQQKLLVFLENIDKKLIISNFKYTKNYKPSLILLYLKIYRFTNYKLTLSEFFKLAVKCILFHKVS